MTHQVKAGLVPSWTGSKQVWNLTLGQGRLILASGNHRLTWERAVKDA